MAKGVFLRTRLNNDNAENRKQLQFSALFVVGCKAKRSGVKGKT